jgi:predicted Zn-dependent protease
VRRAATRPTPSQEPETRFPSALGQAASPRQPRTGIVPGKYRPPILDLPHGSVDEVWSHQTRYPGDIAFRANDLKTASERYSRALELQPNDPEANIGLAKVLMSLDQPQKAEALLKHALQLDPTSPVAHFRLSTIYRTSGRTAEPKQELEEYQKYNKMKEQLRELYHDLHRNQPTNENDSSM